MTHTQRAKRWLGEQRALGRERLAVLAFARTLDEQEKPVYKCPYGCCEVPLKHQEKTTKECEHGKVGWCEACYKVCPKPAEQECKHVNEKGVGAWVGPAWQVDAQKCDLCGVSWRDANPKPATPVVEEIQELAKKIIHLVSK